MFDWAGYFSSNLINLLGHDNRSLLFQTRAADAGQTSPTGPAVRQDVGGFKLHPNNSNHRSLRQRDVRIASHGKQ